jgi:hypothetical protein
MTGQYYLLPIALLLTILFLLSYFLFEDGKISVRTHKIIWGVILTISSLVLVITGLVMVIFIEVGIMPMNPDLTFWHVEFGILTAVTGIFHLQIYWNGVRNLF